MLKATADVVVIGSGGLGAATAFYLAKRNAGAVVLVDPTWRSDPRLRHVRLAAVSCMRTRGELDDAAHQSREQPLSCALPEETGQPLDWVHSGSLKVARRAEDAEVIEADIARGRRLGLDVGFCQRSRH